MRESQWVIGAMALGLAVPVVAQDQAVNATTDHGVVTMKLAAEKQALAEMKVRVPLERNVTGAPYSGDTVMQSSQTLADGTHINRRVTGRVYRDGEGRTRREEDRADGTVGISITDPVAGVSYALDPQTKTAWKTSTITVDGVLTKLAAEEKAPVMAKQQAEVAQRGGGAGGQTPPPPAPLPGAVRSEQVKELAAGPLEHATIGGLAVEGHKNTITIPAGQIGNDQPIVITEESWSSPDLKVLVLTRQSDPRTGDSTYRLENVVRAEPDRSYFMVPPDYTVKESGIRKTVEDRRR